MFCEQIFGEDGEKPKPVKKASDLQRMKLEKLMKNYDKPVVIPERPKEKNLPQAPEFVRNVMGSSAGAGSGEFHVYRHLRRKEYARQRFIQMKSQKELLDEEYRKRVEENARLAEEKTAKKRARRLKKKERMRNRRKQAKMENQMQVEGSGSSGDDDGEEEEKEEGDKRSQEGKSDNDMDEGNE